MRSLHIFIFALCLISGNAHTSSRNVPLLREDLYLDSLMPVNDLKFTKVRVERSADENGNVPISSLPNNGMMQRLQNSPSTENTKLSINSSNDDERKESLENHSSEQYSVDLDEGSGSADINQSIKSEEPTTFYDVTPANQTELPDIQNEDGSGIGLAPQEEIENIIIDNRSEMLSNELRENITEKTSKLEEIRTTEEFLSEITSINLRKENSEESSEGNKSANLEVTTSQEGITDSGLSALSVESAAEVVNETNESNPNTATSLEDMSNVPETSISATEQTSEEKNLTSIESQDPTVTIIEDDHIRAATENISGFTTEATLTNEEATGVESTGTVTELDLGSIAEPSAAPATETFESILSSTTDSLIDSKADEISIPQIFENGSAETTTSAEIEDNQSTVASIEVSSTDISALNTPEEVDSTTKVNETAFVSSEESDPVLVNFTTDGTINNRSGEILKNASNPDAENNPDSRIMIPVSGSAVSEFSNLDVKNVQNAGNTDERNFGAYVIIGLIGVLFVSLIIFLVLRRRSKGQKVRLDNNQDRDPEKALLSNGKFKDDSDDKNVKNNELTPLAIKQNSQINKFEKSPNFSSPKNLNTTANEKNIEKDNVLKSTQAIIEEDDDAKKALDEEKKISEEIDGVDDEKNALMGENAPTEKVVVRTHMNQDSIPKRPLLVTKNGAGYHTVSQDPV